MLCWTYSELTVIEKQIIIVVFAFHPHFASHKFRFALSDKHIFQTHIFLTYSIKYIDAAAVSIALNSCITVTEILVCVK